MDTITGGFAGCLRRGDIVTITDGKGVSKTVLVGAVHESYFKIKDIPWWVKAIWAFFDVFPFLHWRFVPV
jgi:hypothetical protein